MGCKEEKFVISESLELLHSHLHGMDMAMGRGMEVKRLHRRLEDHRLLQVLVGVVDAVRGDHSVARTQDIRGGPAATAPATPPKAVATPVDKAVATPPGMTLATPAGRAAGRAVPKAGVRAPGSRAPPRPGAWARAGTRPDPATKGRSPPCPYLMKCRWEGAAARKALPPGSCRL